MSPIRIISIFIASILVFAVWVSFSSKEKSDDSLLASTQKEQLQQEKNIKYFEEKLTNFKLAHFKKMVIFGVPCVIGAGSSDSSAALSCDWKKKKPSDHSEVETFTFYKTVFIRKTLRGTDCIFGSGNVDSGVAVSCDWSK